MHTALKNYLALAGGLAEQAKDKALEATQPVVMQGLTTLTRVTGLADDVRQQARQNAEAVGAVVKFEAVRALGLLGLAPAQEVTALQERVRTLEGTVRQHETTQAALVRAAEAEAEAEVESAPAARRPAARKRAGTLASVPTTAQSAP